MSKRLLGLVLAAYAIAAPALAQETTTGSLGGQVVDPQGLPLPGVTVTITSTAAPRSVVTDDRAASSSRSSPRASTPSAPSFQASRRSKSRAWKCGSASAPS